jgi:hypothetical protein
VREVAIANSAGLGTQADPHAGVGRDLDERFPAYAPRRLAPNEFTPALPRQLLVNVDHVGETASLDRNGPRRLAAGIGGG